MVNKWFSREHYILFYFIIYTLRRIHHLLPLTRLLEDILSPYWGKPLQANLFSGVTLMRWTANYVFGGGVFSRILPFLNWKHIFTVAEVPRFFYILNAFGLFQIWTFKRTLLFLAVCCLCCTIVLGSIEAKAIFLFFFFFFIVLLLFFSPGVLLYSFSFIYQKQSFWLLV